MAAARKKSAKKSGHKSGRKPGTFTGADDPRRGRGPKKGAANAGRPPDVIRRILREAFADRIPLLVSIAKGEDFTIKSVNGDTGEPEEKTLSPTIEQRMKAMDMLGKYGLGTTLSPMDGDGNSPTRFTLTLGTET